MGTNLLVQQQLNGDKLIGRFNGDKPNCQSNVGSMVIDQSNPLFQFQCSRCLSAVSSQYKRNGRYQHKYVALSSHCHIQVRWTSKKGFFADLVDNIKQEFTKDKQMKESLQKFRKEAEKLEHSEALQKAREKYQSIESETVKGSEVLKQSIETISSKLKEAVEEVEKSDIGKKGKDVVEGLGRTAQRTAETIGKSSEQLAKTEVYRRVSESVKVIKEEIEEATARGRLYTPPKKLRKREDLRIIRGEEKDIEANVEATGVTLHKDSRWYQSWQNFKDNNQLVNKMFDMKMKYDESENLLIRATRTFTDKMSEMFGGMFTKTEMSEVLTEIVKMDPGFDKEKFIKDCQFLMIPNILEAMVQGNLEILEDWCYEAVYNTLAHPIKEARKAGYIIQSKVLDINHIDIVAGKIMEQGPVLVVSFNAQQVMVVRDTMGKVVEGNPEKIMRVFHVWAFCRDQTVLDPIAAWRLIDMSSSPAEQWL
ncbi:hypothetical protein LSH36_878g00009 [Paralvinella palmiformis]|uniref:Mitochondrial import inner membrane translocase subunit TIM44 n=1 Tax=Paralvinella palmiformis TaxID=53620 RepID=A0AAD9IZQ0_9ANNE|nr:hypothetical protein LSH36_878g00009 [Paralvinella palmiformis]